jgi:CRP/FNR family cyclic AMP-dependent transcriptional regulator
MSDPATLPRDLEQLTSLAQRFCEREMFEEAADLYLMALRLDPKSLSVKLGLAEVRTRLRQQRGGSPPRSLRETMREQLRRNAIDAAHFLGLAHLYAEKGENHRAVECLEVARAKDLATPGHYKLHGRIAFRRKDFAAAAEAFTTALRFNPFDREVAESLGRAEFERQQFEASLRATVQAFLLVNDADIETTQRLRRRIQTLKQILGWGHRELTEVFHQQKEQIHTAFDRLEWRRERFMEEAGQPSGSEVFTLSPRQSAFGELDLAARLRRLKLWSHLADEQLFRLARAVTEESYEIGDTLFARGETSRDLYILERGAVLILRTTSYGTFTLGTLEGGELFGESSFIGRQARAGDAVAAQPCKVFHFDAAILDALIEEFPDLGVQIYWSFWHSLARKLRSTNEQLRGFFRDEAAPELRRPANVVHGPVTVESSDKVRLFREQGLSRRELMTLATFSREKRFADGAFLFQEGDEGTEMYIILEGRAIISKLIPGAGEEALAILDRGDFFGEMSLIDGEPRSADAKAYGGPLTVLALDQATVKEVLAMDPHASLEFLQLLCRLIVNRLREIDEKVVGWRIMSGERNEASA